MITVTIRWFSVLAEKRNRRVEEISLEKESSVKQLLDHLSADFAELREFRDHLRVAVNRQYADEEAALSEGDEVAFITPVSGG